MSKRKAKPKQCCHPDCFSCPYADCRYTQMTIEDYIESNRRDREFEDKQLEAECKQKSFDCSGRNEYFRQHYQANREHKLRISREYRKRTHYKSDKDRTDYYKAYYQAHKERKKAQMAERNMRIRQALNGQA